MSNITCVPRLITVRHKNMMQDVYYYPMSKMSKGSDAHSSWCTLLLNESTILARVTHVGAGKFKIIEDKNDGKYVGKIVDASDIFHCR
jgi:hypothetical protein